MSAAEPVFVAIRLPNGACVASPEAIVEVAQAAEELGFDAVSVEDHVIADSTVSPCGPSHAGDDRTVYETMQTLAFVAATTKRVKLLTGVIVLPYRHPILLAKEAASLDRLSGGRLILGIGVGALRVRAADGGQNLTAHGRIATLEFDAFGVTGDRGPMTDEYIEAMTAIWTEPSASYHGRHVSFDGLELEPRPVQQPRIPIWIGGRSEAALRRTARLGDGWCPSQASVEVLAAGRARITELAAGFGRPTPGAWGVNVYGAVAATDEEARGWIRGAMGDRFRTDEALFGATIAGTPETFIRRCDAYRAGGMNVLDLKIVPLRVDAMIAQMRTLARDVLPALREAPRPV